MASAKRRVESNQPKIRWNILDKAVSILLTLGCLAFAVFAGWVLWELRD